MMLAWQILSDAIRNLEAREALEGYSELPPLDLDAHTDHSEDKDQ